MGSRRYVSPHRTKLRVAAAVAVGLVLTFTVYRVGFAGAPEGVDPGTEAARALELEGEIAPDKLVAQRECMEGKGFWVHPSSEEDTGLAEYVLVPNLSDASAYGLGAGNGYGSDFEGKTEEYRQGYAVALTGRVDWKADAEHVPPAESCLAVVNTAIYGSVLPPERPIAFDPEVQEQHYGEDPVLVTAYDEWRRCVASRGDYPEFADVEATQIYARYLYREPEEDEVKQPRAEGSPFPYNEAHERELRLAVDSATCATASGLREAYTAAVDKARERLYDAFAEKITVYRKALEPAAVKAEEVADV